MAELILSTTGPQIKVVFDLAADLPPARADANQLEMAILNLSVNARDAMEHGGGALRISVDVEAVGPGSASELRPGAYVRLRVTDTGVGMSEEVAAKAIEPFFSTKGVGKGTGLGLSMVHGLVTQLGGRMTIDSEPGKGTTVELWLPQSEQGTAAPSLESTQSAPPSKVRRALVVDDEDLVRITVADMIAELGFEVVEGSSAEEALERLADGQTFDVLVTDHLMPGLSGAALAYEVRQRWPQIRTVIISGYADADGVGPDLLRLNKPFRQDELSEILEKPWSAPYRRTSSGDEFYRPT
jgi:CheY-like chemotaxis protein